MYVHQSEEESSKGILKTLGYVISLNKDYFKARDLTNMLGIKPKGRHKLSHSLETLVRRRLIEIYCKNSRNLYYIPIRKRLVDAYYEFLWSHISNHASQCVE